LAIKEFGGISMDRMYKIAMVLLENNEPITTSKIALQLGVSSKTVRNDLKKLEEFVEEEGLKLTKKTGVGIVIEGSDKNKEILLSSIKEETNYIEPFSPLGRQKHILRSLFLQHEKVTAAKLADELYVCTATVNNDLKKAEELISSYNLSISKKDNHILELVGEEKDFRQAISNLIFQSADESDNRLVDLYRTTRLDSATINQLNNLVKIDYSKLESYINSLENNLSFKFTQEAFISLIIHIAIAIKRIKSGKDVLLSDDVLDNLKETKEFESAQTLSLELETSFGVKIPEQEIGYITLHVLGSKIGGKDVEFTGVFKKVEEMELVVEIANKIIATASDALQINLRNDHILLNGLILHLRPTINRLKYDLSLRNPILEEIKNNYPDIFGVAWMASSVFKKYLDKPVPESEVGYIALHLSAALERNRVKTKTLVVCHSGIGTSQLLSARLERCFREIDIVGVVSSTNMTSNTINEVDIIISTVPLKVDKPVLVISPLFTSEDIKKVENYLDGYQNKYIGKGFDISKEYLVKNERYANKNEAIIDICKSLETRGYVNDEFKFSAIKREEIYPTEVGYGVAIPHGNPHEILKPCIAAVHLKHPVQWGTEKVEFVFVICLTENQSKHTFSIFKKFNYEMEQDDFAFNMRNSPETAQIILDKIIG
jgi:transcriptional antiterminator